MKITDLPGNQRFAEFDQHDIHLERLVSDPARPLARHIACMITAVVSSTLFLAGYLVYHAHVGERSTHFTAQGSSGLDLFSDAHFAHPSRLVTLPLVIMTLVPVFRRRWDKHRRIARWTMPIWLYVSVTGVLVYLMLYKWFPPPNLALAGS